MVGIYVLVISVVICVVVAGLVLSQGVKESRVRLYGVLTAAMLALSSANFLAINVKDNQLLFVRLVMVLATLSLYLVYLLVCHIRPQEKMNILLKDPLLYTTIGVMIFSATPLLFSGVEPGVPPTPIATVGVIPYFAYFILLLGLSIARLAKGIEKAHSRKERGQFTLLIIGLVPIMLFSPLTSFLLPYIGINQFVSLTPLYVCVFVFFVGYAIVRHGLFDVKAAIVRGVAYALVLVSLATVYYVLAYAISIFVFGGSVSTGMSMSPVNVILALLLAFLFQPVKRFFDRLTNRLFYKETYDSEEFYARLNHFIRSTTSLRSLLEKSVELLLGTFKSESVAFFIYRNEQALISAGSKGYKKLPIEDVREFDTLRKPVYVDSPELPRQLRRIMVSHRVSVIAPLYLNDKAVGLMCLGEHKVSHYTRRDLRMLRVAAGEIVVGVQNMLAIQEIRDLNDHLQQRIDDATSELRRSNAQLRKLDEAKDEFISMASHQLRTPLTSIKGYVDMILEGDAGEITPMQRKFLTEAFVSSERMVHLINDFLNVSRLQTGTFAIDKRPVDLAKVVGQELDSLKISASGRDLAFRYKKPQSLPKLLLDEGKIRQVIMNFSDNALYYSRPGTEIKVSLEVEGKDVVLQVKDTGIGVPEEEQARLFTKFYRASNARKQRPDGTGVGLYLAKRVITEHGGSVVFSSVEGKGSTFGFRLPLERLRVRDDANQLDDKPDDK